MARKYYAKVIAKKFWGPINKGDEFIFNLNHDHYQRATLGNIEPDICLSEYIVMNNEQIFEPIMDKQRSSHKT